LSIIITYVPMLQRAPMRTRLVAAIEQP